MTRTTPHISVIYYSATGHVHELAAALARGAENAGAEVRLRRVRETAPPEAVAGQRGLAAAYRRDRGLESTILALNNVLYHWGSVIVPLGYAADPSLMGTGNRYGACCVGGSGDEALDAGRRAALIQGDRLTQVAAKLAA